METTGLIRHQYLEKTNLPAVKLLGMFLPHDVETMRNGGVLKERTKRLVQVLQTALLSIYSNLEPAASTSSSCMCLSTSRCSSTVSCFQLRCSGINSGIKSLPRRHSKTLTCKATQQPRQTHAAFTSKTTSSSLTNFPNSSNSAVTLCVSLVYTSIR